MTDARPTTPPPGLLLAGHGTRNQAGVEEFLALAALLRERRPGTAVAAGFIELSPPPLSTAVADLVASGHEELVTVPLMLFDAGHAKTDIPASVVMARAAHPGVRVRYGRALGVHPDLIALTDRRLRAAVPAEQRVDTAVLLVGRGSSDPAANAELHRVARLLWEGRDWPVVEPAYIGMTDPRVPEALERLRRLGHTRIVVVAYFLFTGVLAERIRAQAAAFGEATGVEIVHADHLGPDVAVADLVWDRYDEVLAGPVPRDCDTCVHRITTPGFEEKQGSALRPHHHPDDPGTHGHGHDRSHDHGHGHLELPVVDVSTSRG